MIVVDTHIMFRPRDLADGMTPSRGPMSLDF